MFSCMDEAFSDALITGYEPLVGGMTNDEGDRHVLAAAVVGRADVIVTSNVKHFPRHTLDPLSIEALEPDRFLCLQYDLAPSLVVYVIKEQSADTGRSAGKPRLTVETLLNQLNTLGVPKFTSHIRGHLAGAKLHQRAPEVASAKADAAAGERVKTREGAADDQAPTEV